MTDLPLPSSPPQHRWALGWCRCGAQFERPQEGQDHVAMTGHTVVWEEHVVWCQTMAGPPRLTLSGTVFPSEHTLEVVRTLTSGAKSEATS
ncbi:MAG TPA: hypothetical protein VFD49_09225 [Candidatus Dormibacteraeota bacterium]|nr:hypothetical protein [Candidatus Dormibacteraeota bacterium]